MKVAPPKPNSEPKPHAKKVKPERKPKKVSSLDAAAKMLATTGEPMITKAMSEAMTERGLWTSPRRQNAAGDALRRDSLRGGDEGDQGPVPPKRAGPLRLQHRIETKD